MSALDVQAAPAVSHSARSGRITYLPALDGLRGIAVVAVMIFHAGHLQGGFLGVDLFFTLSGYLITALLLAEWDKHGRIDLKEFWARRARRLLPALYLMMAAVCVWALVGAAASEIAEIRGPGIAALFYVANWYAIFTGNGYWDIFASPSPFEHLWSLAIEEQFYVVWPLVVAFTLRSRAGHRRLLGITAAAVAVSYLLMALFVNPGGDPSRAYLGTDTRAGSILIGGVLALLLARRSTPLRLEGARGWVADAVAGVLLLGLVASWTRLDGRSSVALYRGGMFLHALAVVIIVAVIVGRPGGMASRVLGWSPLRWVGLISYGLYLWHWPVYVALTPDRAGTSGWTLTMVRIGVSFALAIASYHVLEMPIRRRKMLADRGWVPVPVAAGAVAALLVVSTVPQDEPVAGSGETVVTLGTVAPAVPEPAVTTLAPTAPPATTSATSGGAATQPPDTAATTAPATTPATAAPTSAPDPGSALLRTTPPLAEIPPVRAGTAEDPLRVLLVGDSYLYDAQPGMIAALEATGAATVAGEGRLGFTITDDSGLDTLRQLVAEHQPELVVTMWARWDAAWLDTHDRAAYDALLDEAMGILTSNGARVVVTGLAPSATPGVNPEPVERTINEAFAALPARFPGQVAYLDPDPVVAPDGVPVLTIEVPGGTLRVRKVDLSHYCPDGSYLWGEATLALARSLASLPGADPAWVGGEWRSLERFDDPPGACR